MLNDFFRKMFGDKEGSKNIAKKRLQVALAFDRVNLDPSMLEMLKEELIEVITKYMDIDQQSLNVQITREDDSMALVANIPVKKIRRAAK